MLSELKENLITFVLLDGKIENYIFLDLIFIFMIKISCAKMVK